MSRRTWMLVAVVVAVVVAANIAIKRSEQPHGPRSSSYATSAEGAAAYADLLGRLGYAIRRQRTSVEDEAPDPRRTVVVLEPRRLTEAETAALVRFTRAGGRLVTGGPGTADLTRALDAGVKSDQLGPNTLTVAAPVPATAGVRRVESAGDRSYRDAGRGLPLLVGGGAHDAIGAIELRPGRGDALLLADVSPLQNRLLAHADNARLAVALTGPADRTVVFVESVHGYDQPGGLAALPRRWKGALILGALAGLLFMLSRARRLGDPEPPVRELDPPRRAYVDAVASTLVRTKDRAGPTATLRAAARRELAQRTALPAEASEDAVLAAAAAAGLTPEEAAAITAADGQDLIVTGRALARLTYAEEHR